MRRVRPRYLGIAALWLLAAVGIVPLYFMAATSIRGASAYSANPGGFPTHPTLDNLSRLLGSGDFYRWMLNSFAITAISVAITIAAATAAAYALTQLRVPGSALIVRVAASLMVVPPILLVIPLFVELSRLGLIDTYTGAIAVYAGLNLPLSIFMLAQFFSTVPRSFLDASAIDGAGPFRTLTSVLVPLARPAIVTLAIVDAFFVWNELLIALVFLQSPSHRTLMVGVTTIAGREGSDIPLAIAGAAIATIPAVALYMLTQRSMNRGLYGGGLRG